MMYPGAESVGGVAVFIQPFRDRFHAVTDALEKRRPVSGAACVI